MTDDDRSYLLRREREERPAAEAAKDRDAAHIHLRMASEYARRRDAQVAPPSIATEA